MGANKVAGIRTFDLTVSIDGVLDVPFEDWPANIQDGIHDAVEKLAAREECPMQIVYAQYKIDPDKGLEDRGRHYLHVIVSEVVVADERTLAPGRVTHQIPKTLRRH